MDAEETNIKLQDVETKDVEPKDAADPAQVAADADATEADVSDADLNQEEQEKQPMTGGGEPAKVAPSVGSEAAAAVEKNGSVKLKIPEEAEDVKFTGLSKEELLKVAGSPG